MADPLAGFWMHTVTLRRFLGKQQGGKLTYADAETVTGFYEDRDQLVVGPNGEQVTARGVLAVPATVTLIPLDSEITLPAVFGSRVVRVVSTSVADGGATPMPSHGEYGVI